MWVSPLLVFAGTFVTAALTFMGTVIVKRMSRRGEFAAAAKTEAEAEAVRQQAADADADRDLARMRDTLEMTYQSLDRMSARVKGYEQQITELQSLADRRHAFVMKQVEELRVDLEGTQTRIRDHRPWDRRVAEIARRSDPDFPEPPEL